VVEDWTTPRYHDAVGTAAETRRFRVRVSGPLPGHAHLYWANTGAGTIVEADLDGSNPQVIATGQSGPIGVAVDSTHLYWANPGSGTLVEAGLDGSNPQVLVAGQSAPNGVAVSAP
jgi:hypothetical protein